MYEVTRIWPIFAITDSNSEKVAIASDSLGCRGLGDGYKIGNSSSLDEKYKLLPRSGERCIDQFTVGHSPAREYDDYHIEIGSLRLVHCESISKLDDRAASLIISEFISEEPERVLGWTAGE